MLEFILFRHAKTHPAKDGQFDHDRRLTERGHEDAKLVAKKLYTLGARPDLILHSDAQRCFETVECVQSIFNNPPTSAAPELYLAEPHVIMNQVKLHATASDCQSVILIGHNPGLHLLAMDLASGESENEAHVRMGFPTSAAAFFRKETPAAEWSLNSFITPKELKSEAE